ncbi:MAG: hypothetical protein ABIZ64_03105 [Casimicrobium sp.]
MTWFEPLATVFSWQNFSALVLFWLAVLFGRTLRSGQVPLIERIARVSDPALTASLCRYTRRLTGVWSAYFVLAAVLTLTRSAPSVWTGAWVWLGAAVLFIGEHQLRPHLFPAQTFPGVTQQIRDTWRVWHFDNKKSD